MDITDDHFIADRLRSLRAARGLGMEALAAASGVSRAMISRIERGEASPTAALLGKLCAAMDVSLSAFFAAGHEAASPLSRAAEQAVWRDPASGYVRRNVSPRVPGSLLEIVDVTFPPGETVRMDAAWTGRPTQQCVWMLEGTLDLTWGEETTRLSAGDCLHMQLDRPIVFHNPGSTPARYAVVLCTLA
jgi:transcriptional regulator with XRE-family HTH domain